MDDTQILELKARIRKQTRALAESESRVVEHRQRVSELEAALLACQQHSPIDMDALNAARAEVERLTQVNQQLNVALETAHQAEPDEIYRLQEQIAALQEALHIAQQEKQVLEMGFGESAADTAPLHDHIYELRAALETAENDRATAEAELAHSRSEANELRQRLLEQERQMLQPQAAAPELEQALAGVSADRDRLAAEVTQLQEAFFAAQQEKRTLELNGGDVSDLQRRLELAEAHHLVEKRRNDSLQDRLKQLEQECARAYAYADNQDKEVDKLTLVQEELEKRLATLQHQHLQLRATLGEPQLTAVPSPAKVTPITSSIPPLKLPETPSMPSFDQRVQVLASTSAESVQPTLAPPAPRRVDLPVFLQRRA